MAGLQSLWGHTLCAVDVETTGTLPGWHEIIQIAVLPLNQHLEPDPEKKFFYMNIYPDHPERISAGATRKHGITLESLEGCPTQDQAVELFHEWFQKLGLPFKKRVVPLCHNWAFERSMLIPWLGEDGFNELFQSTARDTMTLSSSIDDLYAWHGRKPPFGWVSLGNMCKRFDIELDNAHDALADCVATAKLYASIMRFLYG